MAKPDMLTRLPSILRRFAPYIVAGYGLCLGVMTAIIHLVSM